MLIFWLHSLHDPTATGEMYPHWLSRNDARFRIQADPPLSSTTLLLQEKDMLSHYNTSRQHHPSRISRFKFPSPAPKDSISHVFLTTPTSKPVAEEISLTNRIIFHHAQRPASTRPDHRPVVARERHRYKSHGHGAGFGCLEVGQLVGACNGFKDCRRISCRNDRDRGTYVFWPL